MPLVRHVTEITGNEAALTNVAMLAFKQGLIDGKSLRRPQSGETIIALCGGKYSWRVFHKNRIRQVYEAAFYIANFEKQVPRRLAARKARIRGTTPLE